MPSVPFIHETDSPWERAFRWIGAQIDTANPEEFDRRHAVRLYRGFGAAIAVTPSLEQPTTVPREHGRAAVAWITMELERCEREARTISPYDRAVLTELEHVLAAT